MSHNSSEEFNKYLNILKSELSYADDEFFSWNNVVGLLIIKLTNTDSLNKDTKGSHATQIQLTSEREGSGSARKTEDFFPTLTLNNSFKSWRIAISAQDSLTMMAKATAIRHYIFAMAMTSCL